MCKTTIWSQFWILFICHTKQDMLNFNNFVNTHFVIAIYLEDELQVYGIISKDRLSVNQHIVLYLPMIQREGPLGLFQDFP